MELVEKIEHLFNQIKAGNYSATDELFDTIWGNFTRMAHHQKGRQLVTGILEWSETHAAEHRDFFELAVLTMGSIEFLSDNYDAAMKHLNRAHEMFSERNDKDGVAACSVVIGFVYRSIGEIDLALKYGLQGIEQLSGSGRFKMFRIMGSYWLGGVFADNGHFDEALRLFNDGLNVDYPEGVRAMKPRLTNGMASVYMKQKKFELALEYYQKALELTDPNIEATFRSRGLTDLGDYYTTTGDYEQAIRYNREALALRQQMKILNGSVTNLMNLGKLFSKQNKYSEAVSLLEQGLQISDELGVKVKMYQIHHLLSDIYLETGNHAESLKHFKKFHKIKEDAHHENLERKVQNQVQLFQAQQTQKENDIIKAQKLEIEKEKERSDELLLNILPAEVAEELKSKGKADARLFNDVTVLYTDFQSFTSVTERLSPQQLVDELNICFSAFDEIMDRYNIEKIKTVGDAYLAVSGLPLPNENHACDILSAALDIRGFIQERIKLRGDKTFNIRIGAHSGPVVAGIVGIKKYAYDIWGDTVNTAARMEQNSEPGKINISQTTYDLVKNKINCTYRGEFEAKNKGMLKMYFVTG